MKIYEALKELDYKVLGSGSDFVIVDQYTFERIRDRLAGLVTVEFLENYKLGQAYMIRYNLQYEDSIVNKLIDLKEVYYLITDRLDKSIRFNKEHNSIEITDNGTKNIIAKNIYWCQTLKIEFIQDKLLWEMTSTGGVDDILHCISNLSWDLYRSKYNILYKIKVFFIIKVIIIIIILFFLFILK